MQANSISAPHLPVVPLTTLAFEFLRLGVTAFGFTVLQQLKSLTRYRHWLTEEELDDGLALVQLFPGPTMVDLTAYIGYRLRGVPGALIATLGFILPSFLMMLGLGSVYQAAGRVPAIAALFLGVEALVIGVLLQVTLDLAGRNIQGWRQALIAFAAFSALCFNMSGVLIVLVALALGALSLRPAARSRLPVRSKAHPGSWWAIAGVIAVVLSGVAVAWSLPTDMGAMGLAFFKIGAVAFGNGTTILPLIQAEVVGVHHWLTLNQFADGIALGQITPGPFLITAAFVGYQMSGIGGAALATFAIFSPSIAMTLVFTELFAYLRDSTILRGALAGVLASFVGLLAVVILQLGTVAFKSSGGLVLAAFAFVAARYFKLNVVLIFLSGLAVWSGLLLMGVG